MYVKANDKNYKIIKNSLERINDTSISDKVLCIGTRLNEIQQKHEYLDKDMANLLKITENDYLNLKQGKKQIDISVLNRFKQLFEISIDWLLYDD